MHDIVYLFLMMTGLGVATYGTQAAPLEPMPRNFLQAGIVVAFLATTARHFGLV